MTHNQPTISLEQTTFIYPLEDQIMKLSEILTTAKNAPQQDYYHNACFKGQIL